MEKKYLQDLIDNGIIVIPNYLNKNSCKSLIKQINLFSKTKKVIVEKDEGVGGDIRVFKFEALSEEALNFSKDNFIKNIVSKYANEELKTHFVLAGKVVYNKNYKSNSGGDWHRDGDVKQMKARIYLSEVNEENGPFTFIRNSKSIDFQRRNNKYPLLSKILFKLKGLPTVPPRYNNDVIKMVTGINEHIFKVTGGMGTLVIFDGSYVHRGDVIKKGERHTITNYYYPNSKKAIRNSNKFLKSRI